RWLRYEQGPAKRSAIAIIYRLPLPRQRADDLWRMLKGYNAMLMPMFAEQGFSLLGTNAQPAAPELVRLAKDTRHPTVGSRAVSAMAVMGPSSFPLLTNLLKDTSGPVRSALVHRI